MLFRSKPDPRIYKALLDKYQLKAGESVFIDDRLENVLSVHSGHPITQFPLAVLLGEAGPSCFESSAYISSFPFFKAGSERLYVQYSCRSEETCRLEDIVTLPVAQRKLIYIIK